MKKSYNTPFEYLDVSKCKKHPTYKVMRQPTADCDDCRQLWALRNRIEKK